MSQNGLDVYSDKCNLCGFMSAKNFYRWNWVRLTEATRDLLVIQISYNEPKTLHNKICLTFRRLFV